MKDIIQKFSRSEQDTGSSEVQIALLTQKIQSLTQHFKEHKKDHHSKTGFLKMVSRRKKLLSYLKRKKSATYQKMIKQLSLRK